MSRRDDSTLNPPHPNPSVQVRTGLCSIETLNYILQLGKQSFDLCPTYQY